MTKSQSKERWIDDEFNCELTLTDDDIRDWAFDEDKLLMSQDEDLLIGHERKHYPTFLEFVFTQNCPKSGYIKECIDYHVVHHVIGGSKITAANIIDEILFQLTVYPDSLEWIQRLKKLSALALRDTKPIKEKEALEVARFIWKPFYTQSDLNQFSIKKRSILSFEVWRGKYPSWIIKFNKRNGNMSRFYAHQRFTLF